MTENPSIDIFSWLCLYLVSGVGNAAFRKLIAHFGSPEAVFKASLPQVMQAGKIRERVARNVLGKVFMVDPQKEMKRVEDLGVRLVPLPHPSYPPLLRETHDPPVIVYSRGNPVPSDSRFIAIVGSRNATEYGRRAAQRIAQGLTEHEVGISSGLARGIDASAHWGCLRGRGFPVAVLGTGVDICYPRSNEKLFEKVLEHGAVLSEFPMGTAPEPGNFPKRNRIISGISRGVVVVEANKKSGSLITAALALDQGRDVFAVPGSIDSFKSRGPHFLIKQGAKLVEHAEDILSEMEWYHFPHGEEPGTDSAKPTVQLEPDAERVFHCLGPYPTHIDQIIRSTGCAPGEISSILTRLELMGLVAQLPGMKFVRTQET
jgi:DNA processing protein